MPAQQPPRTGRLSSGMEVMAWGTGPRTLFFLPGGPGSSLPAGPFGRLARRWFAPFVDAGYSVHYVTRRRAMPRGHTVADMADDHADAIAEHLDGHADLVVGMSYGGMVAQYLAARHSDAVGRLALVVSAARVSDWGKNVDARLAAALVQDDRSAAGAAFAEYVAPGPRSRWLRHAAGPWLGRALLSGRHYPAADLLVETEAEIAFDAREVLPRIRVPVLLACGDRDRFFPPDIVEETVRLVPDATLVTYPGGGHMKVASSRHVVRDVLAFAERG
jgi:pimeloyl-ACP methyl ester carboxylesterase